MLSLWIQPWIGLYPAVIGNYPTAFARFSSIITGTAPDDNYAMVNLKMRLLAEMIVYLFLASSCVGRNGYQ